METRQLGRSGFLVPALTFGTGTFGGGNEIFKAWGASDAKEATRLVDICLEAGLNMFDSADGYSNGMAEEILGQAIKGRARGDVLISTKGSFRRGPGANQLGHSRYHLINAVEASLKRLGTDYIDLYQLHAYDAMTPVEESLGTLTDLVRAGKIRYIGCSNLSGWHLMKSLAASEKYGLARYVAHQAYYSLIGRDYEWELMPLALEQGVGATVWSPLGWGRLGGKLRRGRCPRKAACRARSPSTRARRCRTSMSSGSWMQSTRSPGKPARPTPRSRSTGSCSAPRYPRSLSAQGTKSSCGRTWVRSAGSCPRSRSPRWTQPAR
jgi:aryl-alcohol dehydrogenase-like predicted oxidoreductase